MRIKKITGFVFLAAVLSCFFSTALADPIGDIPGGDNIHQEYSGNFKAGDLNLVNTHVDKSGYLALNTGNDAIDPNHIVIPFTQDVSVTFLYEGTDYQLTDFGWMLAEGGISGPKHEIYRDINDNDRNGVLDRGPDDQNHAYGDTNGDGTIDARDNKIDLGRFAGGTELVFYLKVDDEDKIYYTRNNWNADDYSSISGECSPALTGNTFTKTYHLGRPQGIEGVCSLDGNWLPAEAYWRAEDLFDLQFGDDIAATLEIEHNKPFSHVIVAAAGNKPHKWILGWEDCGKGGDTDHNDLLFQIERESGGTAQLPPEKTIIPGPDNDFFTGVTVAVYDQMPCAGKTAITYELLHGDLGDANNDGKNDNELIKLEITDWDEVHSFTLNEDGTIKLGRRITGWQPGNPEFTYRTRRLDLAGLGLAPGLLSWQATFNSREDACVPRVIGLALDAGVAAHGLYSRSSPVVIANMLYSANYETPAQGWDDKAMRGHLVATRLYDPRNPADTDTANIWDAGEVLNQKSPEDRVILFPDMKVSPISNEKLAAGNGLKRTFSGTLRNHPLLATSIIITDQTERFCDKNTAALTGNLGGTGTINRFTGDYEITFNTAPVKNQPITASYNHYQAGQQLLDFKADNVTHAMLGLDNTKIFPGDFLFDFNNDGDYTLDDGSWLINWVRGYKDGKSTPKQWLLGAIDHSAPAAATPPGNPAWLLGTATSAAERKSYESYQIANAQRPTVMYVGARDGMLHAFGAGKFRHGDNDRTAFKEYRGYFKWQDKSDDCPDFRCGDCTECPDYGTGEELWAFIPANLIPRLKNNLLQANDQAYVDASPAITDVFIGDQWKTVLISSEGNGGDTVFCLDVTDPHSPKLLWEFADPELFRSDSLPSVPRVGRIVDGGTTRWVAFFASGKTGDANRYPSLFIIDIADGSLVRRIFLDTDADGVGGMPSGQPAIIDSDGNGYLDRIYIGSNKGRLYKINLPDDPNNFDYINHCVINGDFIDDNLNELPLAQQYHPIYGSPAAVVDSRLTPEGKISYNIKLFYGTGDNPYYDEDIDLTTTRHHLYAYRDEDEKGSCGQNRVHLEWFYELPAGQRIFAPAFAAAGNIYFGTAAAKAADPGPEGDGQNTKNGGGIYALSMGGELIMTKNVGDIITPPLVVDEHLYTKSQLHGLQSFGSGPYNNPVKAGSTPEFKMLSWREFF